MDIHALQLTLREFAAARNWQPFHTPKNLSTALMVETAELAEIFQWMTSDESQAAHLYPAMKERIADEVADVLLYLLQLADHCAIDMPGAVASKLVKNATKYPALNPSRKRAKASESAIPVATTVVAEPVRPTADAKAGQSAAQTHVLVDWENVQPKDQDIQTLVPPVTDVWLFHGPSQKNVSADQALFGQRATLVPIARAGKNALDFHLSFYMGYIASRSPQANFVVISNDKGYLPMLEHAQSLGFSARQIGFVKAKGVAKKAAVKRIGVKTATNAVTTAQTAAKTVAVSARQKVARSAPVKKAVAVKKIQAGKQLIAVTAKQAPKDLRSASAKKTVTVTKTPKTKAVAGNGKSVPTRPTNAPSIKTQAPDIQNKPGLAWDLDKAVRHVQASLQKTTNKPSRKARLLAAVTSLLNESSSDAAIVTDVLAKLVSRGFVRLDEKGGVHFNP
jgi:NTP pyrophosphatase (non-canonical NTP hydrolase)